MLERFRDYSNPNSLGSHFRRTRFRHVKKILEGILQVKSECKVLDVGGTAQYWNLLPDTLRKSIHLTILNLKNSRGADPRLDCPQGLHIDFVIGDGRDLSQYSENEFDLGHSNSVIEHVGQYHDMADFVREINRVASIFFIQTPNLWFPIDPHYGVPFVHWFPWPLRAWLLTKINLGFRSRFTKTEEAIDFVEFVNVIDKYIFTSLNPTAAILKERVLFLTKSLMMTNAENIVIEESVQKNLPNSGVGAAVTINNDLR